MNSKIIFPNNIQFNPNGFIDHLTFFYLFLKRPHDYKIKIPFTTLNKYISRIKIESILCAQEKSHNNLSFLSKITSLLNISCKNIINKIYNNLSKKSLIILKGLNDVLNFKGIEKYSKTNQFIFENGNFLDIFIEKSEEINLENDLVNIAKYVQYCRDNFLRKDLYEIFTKMKKKEECFNIIDMNDEFARANDRYKYYNVKRMNLPKEIKYPQFSLHPLNVDYLFLCEVNEKDFKNDLNVITKLINVDQTYGKRNLYDRLNFLFSVSNKKKKNEINYYSLHKNNPYLRVMRVLFRYFNNLDLKDSKKKFFNKEDSMNFRMSIYKKNSSMIQNKNIINKIFPKQEKININNINESLTNIIIEEFNLRIINENINEDELKNLSEVQKRNYLKINLLKYSENFDSPETLLDLSNEKLTSEQIKKFTEITKLFISKCQNRLKNLDEITIPFFIKVIQYYIRYFLLIKKEYQKDKKLWENINLECFYQLFRFSNRNDFNYKKNKN